MKQEYEYFGCDRMKAAALRDRMKREYDYFGCDRIKREYKYLARDRP